MSSHPPRSFPAEWLKYRDVLAARRVRWQARLGLDVLRNVHPAQFARVCLNVSIVPSVPRTQTYQLVKVVDASSRFVGEFTHRFRHEEEDQAKLDAGPDQQNVKRPSPASVLINKPSDKWTNLRSACLGSARARIDLHRHAASPKRGSGVHGEHETQTVDDFCCCASNLLVYARHIHQRRAYFMLEIK